MLDLYRARDGTHPRQGDRVTAVIRAGVIATAMGLAWTCAAIAEYRYPYHDPYVATATSAIVNADRLPLRSTRQIIRVPGLPGRDHLPSLEGRGKLSVALYRQHHPAPLLFIVPGVGSNPYFGVATYFAGLFHREGFHVVVLPSPMTWNFALAASRSGAPGYPPEDARDLYTAMQATLAHLRSRYDVRTTDVSFMGVSLGALEGAYVSVLDSEERAIGIDRYLLVNPPVDLAYALERIDEWDMLGQRFGRDKSERLVAKALDIVESFSTERGDDPAVFDRMSRDVAAFTTEELQFLIAQDVRLVLPELAYVTQVINAIGNGRTKDEARRSLQDARNMSYREYRERIALPVWRRQAGEPEASAEAFARRGSLPPIVDRLRANPKVHIVHNADDVFVDRNALEDLKQALGDQVTLYPHGGHLGNLWYADNKDDALRFLGVGDERFRYAKR